MKSLSWFKDCLSLALIVFFVTMVWIGAAMLAQYFQSVHFALLPQ